MLEKWKQALWSQYGAAIDAMEASINACPEEVWGPRIDWYQPWYYAYHTLFFLDYYLSDPNEDFHPPEPFSLTELDASGTLPARVFTKEELLHYLKLGRDKCRARIEALTEETAHQSCGFERLSYLTVVELMLYTMRHVQHHTAQINLLLRQKIDSAPGWSFTARR